MTFDFGNANEAQRIAISTTDGPLLIIAGPGTGKTYILRESIYSQNKHQVQTIDECKSSMYGSREKVKIELIKGTNLV